MSNLRGGCMRSSLSLKTLLLVIAGLIAFCLVALTQGRNSSHASGLPVGAPAPGCPSDNAGLKLPPGFCATVFADGMGHARHMVVAPDGVLYVNTWSGRYYGNGKTHPGGFLVALQDKAGSGKADVIERFGETVQPVGAAVPVSASTKIPSTPKSTTASY